MKALWTGLTTFFSVSGGSFKSTVNSQFYPDEAICQASGAAPSFPYAVYSNVFTGIDYDFSDQRKEYLLQISIFSQSSSKNEALTILDNLETWLANSEDELIVAGYKTLEVTYQNYRELREPLNNVWHIVTEWKILLEREK